MIIVTRPSPYGEELTQLCHQAGITAQHLPFFNMIKGRDFDTLQWHLDQLKIDDIVITVSPQVTQMLRSHQKNIIFPDFVRYFAIGQQTAHQFEKISHQPVDYPHQDENSEGLIQYFQFLDIKIKHQHVLILCGDIGRTVIKDHLHHQGAQVKDIHCYQRQVINYPTTIFADNQQYVFVVTSIEHLLQLNRYCSVQHKQHHRLIVTSLRVYEQAQQLNWQHIYWVKNANNQNLFKTIATLCHNA